MCVVHRRQWPARWWCSAVARWSCCAAAVGQASEMCHAHTPPGHTNSSTLTYLWPPASRWHSVAQRRGITWQLAMCTRSPAVRSFRVFCVRQNAFSGGRVVRSRGVRLPRSAFTGLPITSDKHNQYSTVVVATGCDSPPLYPVPRWWRTSSFLGPCGPARHWQGLRPFDRSFVGECRVGC